MTAVTINEAPTTYPQETLSNVVTPGEYVDGGGSVPADLPNNSVLPGWHLIVEAVGGSTILLKQTLVALPTPTNESYPYGAVFARYKVLAPTQEPNSSPQWTSWQQVPA